jgi:3-deoxy-manno-octulosonate cytidylyltransferase (CMP-KDO synthetase)
VKSIAIIPARYASTRFPGKPLAIIEGTPMIQHVYERCCEAFDLVAVATDDVRIEEAVHAFGGLAVMTASNHPSGTDRCAEAAEQLARQHDFDIVVNVQGDEPFIEKKQLDQILDCFEDEKTDIATLVSPIRSNDILMDSNKVKAVRSVTGFALYFSRHPIPFQRDVEQSQWINKHEYYLHLGLYAYRYDILKKITQLKQSPLEESEKLEQLRWLENGYQIKTTITQRVNIGIDTPEDLESLLKQKH